MTAEVCPYCRAPIVPEEPQVVCSGCGTRHHQDCYEENCGCTIFGCSCAPTEEPKLSVSAPELVAVATSTATTVTAPPAVAPPPPPLPREPAPSTIDELRQISNTIVPSMFGSFVESGNMPEPEQAIPAGPPRKRTTYILLGALLGAFGAHSFYAGYKKKGGIQLAVTLLTLGFGAPMSWMWAIIDICTINQDSSGVQFES